MNFLTKIEYKENRGEKDVVVFLLFFIQGKTYNKERSAMKRKIIIYF